MTEKIENGRYVTNSFGDRILTVEYIDELLQGIKSLLTARRGSFYPNKNFGSYIKTNALKQPIDEYALAFARQALDRLDGVYVKSVSIDDNSVVFTVDINDEERSVKIDLENDI